MKTLALIVLQLVVVFVPSWVSISNASNIIASKQTQQTQQPYRGGSRREFRTIQPMVEI